MKDHERMSHKCSFSPWSSTFKASSAASGGHALVISDVYLSSGRDKQSILLLSSPPLQQTSACLQKPTETQQLCLAILTILTVQFFNFDNFSFVEFFRVRSPHRPHLSGVQRELQEALRVQGGQQNGTGHADVERNAPGNCTALRGLWRSLEISGGGLCLTRWSGEEVKRSSCSSWGSSCGSMWRKEINIEMKSQMLQQPILSKSTFS